MGVGMSRFPDPYQSRDDLSHAAVFLVAFLLLVTVGAVIFYGNAWVFAPETLSSQLPLARASPTTAVRRPTPGAPPTFSAPTPPPPLAGIALQPTPSGTGTPTTAPATPVPGPQGGTPTTVPSPSVLPTPSPLPVAHVGNTGGDGVYLRHTPHLNDRWIAWPDNTPLMLMGNEADGDGQHWLQVRDPKGDVGWVPAQYVRR